MLEHNERWRMIQADCIEAMADMPDACFDFAIFSPPFPSLFSYTDMECDLGNSESFAGDAKMHLAFFWHQFARLLKPGRVCIVHCQQIAALKRNGELSTTDLRGLLIRLAKRATLGQVAKGEWKGKAFDSNKPQYIADLMASWRKDESTLVWCLYDHEQDSVSAAVGGDSMYGSTSLKDRMAMIDRFKRREVDTIISKPRILGFGLNLQVATRQVFSGLQDSYEQFHQCVKRSNRIGSKLPLNVHIPVTELEEPMVENVLRKAKRVDEDTREQELMFREHVEL